MRATLASCLQQFSNIKTMRYIFSPHIHHSYTKAVHRSLNNHAIHILGKCIFQVIHTPLLLLYTTMIYLEKMEFSVFYFIPPSGRESSKKQFPDFLCRLMVSVQCCLSGYSSFCVMCVASLQWKVFPRPFDISKPFNGTIYWYKRPWTAPLVLIWVRWL